MTDRLTGPEKAACLTLLETTWGKAMGWETRADMDTYMRLVDPTSAYPAPMVYAAIQAVCANHAGYPPKPGVINEQLRDMAHHTLTQDAPTALAPPGMDEHDYRAWLREQRWQALTRAYPPWELDKAAAATTPTTTTPLIGS